MLSIVRSHRQVIIKTGSVTILILNIISLVFGMIYLTLREGSIFWNIYGFLMLLTILGNIMLTAISNEWKVLSYLYLFLSAFFMVLIPFLNTLVSIDPSNRKSQSTISAILLFSLFVIGGSIAEMSWKNNEAENLQSQNKSGSKCCRIAKHSIIILLSAILYFGLFLAVNLLRVNKNGLLEVFISEYALFFAVTFLSIGILILKLLNRKKYSLYYSIVLTVTIFVFSVCLLPFLSIPELLYNARINYNAAFGKVTEDLDISKNYYRRLPFSIPDYFYGIPSKDYQVQEHVLFYQGSSAADQGLKLYYDVYSPVGEMEKLPNGYPVLIRIHGGAWTSGDKGQQNFAQMNKYFAAQGYLVFDIQYGLNDIAEWFGLVHAEKTRMGAYSVDDMIRHVGMFTDYLVMHQSEYHADLNSVFISGGSAGGQLALACVLSAFTEAGTGIINPGITVKGVIPFYPANGLSLELNIRGKEEWVDPIRLINKNSPPCLIYQGSHDGLVNHSIADSFRKAYLDKGNDACAVITMPFGGHASDLYFSGYYNQVFLYYMECFMYQYR